MLKFKTINIELIALFLSLLIVLNYTLMFVVYNNYIGKIIVPIYVLTLIIFFIIQPTKHIVFKLSLIFLILIAAGSPLTRWDAWAIWLFHAKRIFIEENFFITLNNYTNLHNDYPLMMPSFAVSFAQFLNGWNIIFPKISIFFLYMPPLIYSLKIFDNLFSKVFLILTFILLNEFLFNGYIDGLIAIYFSFSLYLSYDIFIKKNKGVINIAICLFFLVILSLLKNEGFVLTFIIVSFALIYNILNFKRISFLDKSFVIYFSLIPYLIWKLICIKNGIENDLVNEGSLERFLSLKIFLENIWVIFKSLFLNIKFIVSLIMFLASFVFFKNNMLFKITIYCSLFYIFVLIFIYLTTPHDLNWHLNTSSQRTMMTISYLFGFISIINLSRKFDISQRG